MQTPVRYILSLIFTWILGSATYAAEIEGKILFVSGKIQEVTLLVPMRYTVDEPDYASMQNSIVYIDSTGDKHTVKPKAAQRISFIYKGAEIHMLSEFDTFSMTDPDSYGTSKVFLKIEIDGPLKLFSYYSTGNYYKNTSYAKHEIIQKNNGSLLNYDRMVFQTDFVAVVKDCPDLVKKINDKKYSKSDIETIIKQYNATCKCNTALPN